MTLKRRGVLAGIGGAAVGAFGALGGSRIAEAASEQTPLPFYGSAVSAVRPDGTFPGAEAGAVLWAGAPTRRRVALTFDDGPHRTWTPQVLAALDRHDVPATFFVRGDRMRAQGQVLRDASPRHEVGNHSWDHPDLGRLSYAACRDQLQRTGDEIERIMGAPATLFRPPYGHLGGSSVLAAAELGLTTTLWSAQMHEDRFVQHPAGIVEDIRGQLRPGAIILAHDAGSADRVVTIENLDAILAALVEDGYKFATVSTLCDLPTPAGPHRQG